MNIPAQGTYQAKTNGQLVVYVAERTGSLCVAIPLITLDANPAWNGKFVATIITGDGTVQTKTIENLKKCFGWDGVDPFWLMATNPEEADQEKWQARDLSECALEIVGGPNEYQSEAGETKVNFKVQWLNPAGQSGTAMPSAASRKDIMSKFGAKLRALNASAPKPAAAAKPADKTKGEKPAAAAAKPAATATPSSGATSKSKSSGPPKPAPKQPEQQELAPAEEAPECDMETAWNALVAARPDVSEAEQGEIWYKVLEEMFPGKGNDDLDAKQFGALKVKFESMANA